MLKWTEPDDTILDNTVLSEWECTIVVRKAGSVPENIKDGVTITENRIRNQYKNAWLEDTNNLINGVAYFYRFFTISKKGVANYSSPTVKITATEISPILAENSWGKIAEISEAGTAGDIWAVGDEKNLTLSGNYTETQCMQIWGFNHYDKADGTGKAGLVIGCKNLMNYKRYYLNTDHNYMLCHGWRDSDMRNTTMSNVYSSLPMEIQTAIKTVTIKNNYSEVQTTQEKVFIPGVGAASGKLETEEAQLPIFTDNASRIKKLSNGSGSNEIWALRSFDSRFSHIVYHVNTKGEAVTAGNESVHGAYGVCFCFCI